MHRAQILLEEWQYQTVRSQAARRGISISACLRELLNQSLARRAPKSLPLSSIKGIGASGTSGRDHDSTIYGYKI